MLSGFPFSARGTLSHVHDTCLPLVDEVLFLESVPHTVGA